MPIRRFTAFDRKGFSPAGLGRRDGRIHLPVRIELAPKPMAAVVVVRNVFGSLFGPSSVP
jgi:hypothetical protein